MQIFRDRKYISGSQELEGVIYVYVYVCVCACACALVPKSGDWLLRDMGFFSEGMKKF